MTEGVKTLVYVGVALVVGIAAFVSRPVTKGPEMDDQIGQPLFEDFTDPADAASMKITKYNSELGEIRSFEVARKNGTGAWTIPSHSDYPADAEEQMRDAALMLIDLKVLAIKSREKGDHELYGVKAPDPTEVKLGDDGVGDLLSFKGKKDQDIASVIIGKTVKGMEDTRFVRIPNQDLVYVVKIQPDKLSTKFDDWIETDLLQLSSFDIEDVTINDYTVERLVNRAALKKEFDLEAKYADNKWNLVELTRYADGEPKTVTELPEGKELNGEKLNDLKTAVDSLKIVDVQPKPVGLGVDLKAGADFTKDTNSQEDLVSRGFYPYAAGDGPTELLCANGEVHVGLKDGVEYVLRFGETVTTASEEPTEGKSRYLFVTTRVNLNKFPQPEKEPLPELPSKKDGDAQEEDSAEAAEGDAEKKDVEAEEAEILQERERIEKENKRKEDEWNEKMDKAKQRVAELNTRFGDWYYIVSEEEYDKIRLPLSELLKDKEKEESEGVDESMTIEEEPEITGDGVDAFRQLQESGLE